MYNIYIFVCYMYVKKKDEHIESSYAYVVDT